MWKIVIEMEVVIFIDYVNNELNCKLNELFLLIVVIKYLI